MNYTSAVTIRDIAKRLNLSVSTVSRALAGKDRIGEETTMLVKQTAKEMGYRPNLIASSLRTSKTNVIGLIVSDLANSSRSALVSSIQKVASECGYAVTVVQSNSDKDREKEIINELFLIRVDGIIVATTFNPENDKLFLQAFQNKNLPVVFFYRRYGKINFPVVQSDDRYGAFAATEHLIQQGCKQINYISGPLEVDNYKQMYYGFREAMEEYQLPVSNKQVYFLKSDTNDVREVALAALSGKKLPDGLFACTDYCAFAAIQVAAMKGIKIPSELAVVGYSNDSITELISPALTSIDLLPNELAKAAFESLLNEMAHDKSEYCGHKIIPIKLVTRESSMRSAYVIK